MHHPISIANLRAALFTSALALSTVTAATWAEAQGAAPESATAEQKATAQKAFEKGMKASKAKKHEDALAAFKESYGAVASPNSHLMVARELIELGRLEEAWAEYEKTVVEAEAAAQKDPKYADTATGAKNEQNDLKGKLGFVKLTVTGAGPGSRVTVRGKEIPEADWGKPVAVMPGSVRVELVASDGKEIVQEVNATAGSETPVTLAPPAAAPAAGNAAGEGSAKVEASTSGKGPSMRTWAYIAGGVGVAGLATFGIFGAMNNAKHSKLEDECKDGVCPSNLEDEKDTGKTYQTIANVGLVVGVVGLGTGTVLYLMSGKKTEKAAALPKRRGPRVESVSVGYQSVLVSGSF
ncbi:MAG: tetratricopeptide repeat protein [Myxococcales bacterium]|nr:tetratricopeptide repeat protein [Myxococcales bacterium]